MTDQNESEIRQQYAAMLADTEHDIAKLRKDLESVSSKRDGECWVVVALTMGCFCVHFETIGQHIVCGLKEGSAIHAQRFTKAKAQLLAGVVKGHSGRNAAAMHIADALMGQIASQEWVMDVLRRTAEQH